jgi:hypothetical protein
MVLKRRINRKTMTVMPSIRLVAQNTKRVWSRRAGRALEAGPPGGPRSVCAEGFMIR